VPNAPPDVKVREHVPLDQVAEQPVSGQEGLGVAVGALADRDEPRITDRRIQPPQVVPRVGRSQSAERLDRSLAQAGPVGHAECPAMRWLNEDEAGTDPDASPLPDYAPFDISISFEARP
jgi:hypothetical protein